MFQFPGFASHAYAFSARYPDKSGWVAPFGDPRITARLPTPLGLSQVSTSFIASRRQVIRRVPFGGLIAPTRRRRPCDDRLDAPRFSPHAFDLGVTHLGHDCRAEPGAQRAFRSEADATFHHPVVKERSDSRITPLCRTPPRSASGTIAPEAPGVVRGTLGPVQSGSSRASRIVRCG